ncbi:conserved hypothetical protein [Cupriavidus taiwanensis]|nr:conserved hypothetical protein [Cupriavidus taiwanensis]SOZ25602.1 conserved hypothetical protein [Cupriavidus taiwanensis]SOZ44852.1 conserved hypothetical protein [Cupriavidus taiwanensis]
MGVWIAGQHATAILVDSTHSVQLSPSAATAVSLLSDGFHHIESLAWHMRRLNNVANTMETIMPKASSIAQAKADKRAGKSPSTQASHFVRDEIEAVRHGKHGVRSAKQAIAIGLSEARRAGVELPPKASTKSAAAKSAAKPAAKSAGEKTPRRPSSESTAKRRSAAINALKRESTAGASHQALSAQAKRAASKRTAADRSAAAEKAARTKGAAGRSEAAQKAARTRAANKRANQKPR